MHANDLYDDEKIRAFAESAEGQAALRRLGERDSPKPSAPPMQPDELINYYKSKLQTLEEATDAVASSLRDCLEEKMKKEDEMGNVIEEIKQITDEYEHRILPEFQQLTDLFSDH